MKTQRQKVILPAAEWKDKLAIALDMAPVNAIESSQKMPSGGYDAGAVGAS
jgi:hypothetical protein